MILLVAFVVLLVVIAVAIARRAERTGRYMPRSGSADLGQAEPREAFSDADESLIGNRRGSSFFGSDGGRGW
jgi:hypothetical protein